MAFQSYSNATWAWLVLKDGKFVEGAIYTSKAEADRKAAEIGGTVKKTRY